MIFSKRVKQLALLLVGLSVLSSYSYAEIDPRMVVEIVAGEQGQVPTVQDAAGQALPVLWDRVIEDSARTLLSDKIRATPFLQRVVPDSEGVQVIFNPSRVWQYLDEHQIAYIKLPPRLNLQIKMVNQNDASMPKTAAKLREHAESIALKRGLVLDRNAPVLIASWRWLDASRLQLTVQDSPLLAGFSETRSVHTDRPLAQLNGWVEDLLLKVRDARSMDTDIAIAIPQERDNGLEFILTIEMSATLPEQVVLEDALRQNSRVQALIPTSLSSTRRQYRVLLEGEDDTWVAAWFQHRGMQVTSTPYGWLVQ